VSGQLHTLAALPLVERGPGAYWIGGWVDCRVGLDDMEKKTTACTHRESNPCSPQEKKKGKVASLNKSVTFHVTATLNSSMRKGALQELSSQSKPICQCSFIKNTDIS
jgi:hypothetical protein